jgi:hypothetical protein
MIYYVRALMEFIAKGVCCIVGGLVAIWLATSFFIFPSFLFWSALIVDGHHTAAWIVFVILNIPLGAILIRSWVIRAEELRRSAST